MSYEVVLKLLFLFFIYSFCGWILEVIAVSIKEKKFINRGITNGPLCIIYGFGAVLITLALDDITSIFGIFIGSVIYTTIIEFIAGHLLEKFNKNKWWDYSNKKFNLDGYICLEYSLIWGVLGILAIKVFNPLLLFLFNEINIFISSIIIFSLIFILIMDFATSLITLKTMKNTQIKALTTRFGNWIYKNVEKRITKAYPIVKEKKVRKKSKVFAEGCSFYKLFIIFLIGAFIGDLVEIVFCRFTMDRWMSRSSLIWGQFSLVWGFALAIATLLLYKYRNRADSFLFVFGTIMGGAYEYICSVFTEVVYGTIYWDYSGLPFNINGRINLLYCFFWGMATVIFIKKIYPFLSNVIEKIPKKLGTIICNSLIIFMIVNIIVSSCVMWRYNQRIAGLPAENIIDELCDKYYNNERVENRWPNAKKVK